MKEGQQSMTINLDRLVNAASQGMINANAGNRNRCNECFVDGHTEYFAYAATAALLNHLADKHLRGSNENNGPAAFMRIGQEVHQVLQQINQLKQVGETLG